MNIILYKNDYGMANGHGFLSKVVDTALITVQSI